jgi:S1-C subfamily serine protease
MLRDVAKRAGVLLCAVSVLLSTVAVGQGRGESEQVWLGVLIDDESLDGGVLLMAVIPGGPAAMAGLQRGDVLLEAGGRGLVRTEDLEAVLELSDPGDSVPLKLLRSGTVQERKVELARRPSGTWTYLSTHSDQPSLPEVPRASAARAPTSERSYGFAVTDMTPDLRVYYGAPERAGVLVTEVRPGRAADRAGIRVGDVLVQLGDVKVHHATDVDDLLPVGEADKETVDAWVVRDSRSTLARLLIPRLRSRPVDPDPPDSDSREFQALERALESEIERLGRRLAELEQRLNQLREAREEAPER